MIEYTARLRGGELSPYILLLALLPGVKRTCKHGVHEGLVLYHRSANGAVVIWCFYCTYSSIELHKRRGGAVVEVWLQPSSLHITVSDGRACEEEKQEALRTSNICSEQQDEGVQCVNVH